MVHELEKKAIKLRIMTLEMMRDSEASGHYGGSMSVMDILTTLYFGGIMRVSPVNPKWEERDRFILSKGHACAALCPVLAEKGFFSPDILPTFNKLDSPFGMHPDMNKILGCDMSTGSLGHGTPIAAGMAMAGKYLKKDYRVYVVLSDGEVAEGSTWEAIEIISHFKLDNLCATIDRNKYSLDGPTEGPGILGERGIEGTMTLEPIGKKLEIFGWHVIECDGHNFDQLLDAYEEAARVKGKPTMVIAHTVKGKEISFIEDKYEWHYGQFNSEQYRMALEELNNKLKQLEQKSV
ncbi:transketolase [Candidatus Aerophobetes bacterium]|nr:transketolase [Candidatus Aerophobetes bacterium]